MFFLVATYKANVLLAAWSALNASNGCYWFSSQVQYFVKLSKPERAFDFSDNCEDNPLSQLAIPRNMHSCMMFVC